MVWFLHDFQLHWSTVLTSFGVTGRWPRRRNHDVWLPSPPWVAFVPGSAPMVSHNLKEKSMWNTIWHRISSHLRILKSWSHRNASENVFQISSISGPHWMRHPQLQFFVNSQICFSEPALRSQLLVSWVVGEELRRRLSLLLVPSECTADLFAPVAKWRWRCAVGSWTWTTPCWIARRAVCLMPGSKNCTQGRDVWNQVLQWIPINFRRLWNLMKFDWWQHDSHLYQFALSRFDHWIARHLELNQLRLDPVFPA